MSSRKHRLITAKTIIRDVASGFALGLAVSAAFAVFEEKPKHKPSYEPSCRQDSTFVIGIDGVRFHTKNNKKMTVDNKEFTVQGDYSKIVLRNPEKTIVLPQGKYVQIGEFKFIYVKCQD